jgi:polysaccharide biosynthesis protein PelE
VTASSIFFDTSASGLTTLILAHLALSVLLAFFSCVVMPKPYQQDRWVMSLLLFCFAFAMPVVGAPVLMLLTRWTRPTVKPIEPHSAPVKVELPEFDLQSKDVARSGLGANRSRLEAHVPSETRMRSLMTLQNVHNRVSNPILDDLLGDSSDEVRLVAFGMLDSEEKKLSTHIQRERDLLMQNLPPEQRYDCLRHLAELHWELIYASLAQGELRRHILQQALKFLDEALAMDMPSNAGLFFLKGRILLAQGQDEKAGELIELSAGLGQSPTSTAPYLAELAFKRKDYAQVKQYMRQLSVLSLASKTRAISDLWSGRKITVNLSDRRFHPHI